MIGRRLFLKFIVPVSVSVPAAAVSEVDECEHHAQKLAEAMQAVHGGNWKAVVRHDLGGVYVLNASPR